MEPTIDTVLNEIKELRQDVKSLRQLINHISTKLSIESEWMTYEDARKTLGCTVEHMRNLASLGKIKTRPKGKYRVNRESLEKYMNSKR